MCMEKRDQTIGSFVNLAAALALVEGDRELLGELVSVFLQECPAQLAAVREAVQRQDPQGLQRTAHLLKGSVATFGSNPALELVARLEARGCHDNMGDVAPDLAKLEQALDGLRDGLLQLR